jgi:CHAT domain-containing protein
LPGTRSESDRVAGAFAGAKVALLRGPAASETQLRRLGPQARYVHLATHGLVDETRSELLAALALSAPARPSVEDDGFLYLHEIVGLRWNCELAVLSACSTQRGRQVGGEGVFALSRAFQGAGARRAVASLWAVSDASTAELVGDFFARLAAAESAGQRPEYARALRDAKLRLRRAPGTASPFHWAAFVLSGAG